MGQPNGNGRGEQQAGGFEGLYPFLYSGENDTEAVLEQVRQSTVAKAEQTLQMRQQVLDAHAEELVACAAAMARSFAAGGRLFTFGNGGSATDAQGLVQTFLHPEPGSHVVPDGGVQTLPALSLTNDIACVTALANDVGFEVVFARQVAAAGRPGDVAVGLSTSGGSANVLRAFEEAHRRGLLTVGLAGYDGGRMAEFAEDGVIDHLFVVPSDSIHRIQESQTTVYHVLWELCQQGLAATDGGA